MGIRDVARQLGVSIGTVSRALNDRPDVSEATRARVKAAAARLGYVPNQSGRSLRTGRTGMVAGIVPAIGPAAGSEGIFLPIFEGARKRLREDDLDLVMLFCGDQEAPEVALRRLVARRIVDGVILTRTLPEDARVACLHDAEMPHVAFGRSRGLADTAWVDFDVAGAVEQGLAMLHAAGHRRFALCLRDHGATFTILAEAAFLRCGARAGLAGDALQVLRLHDAEEAADALARQRPTAVFAVDEALAASLYRVFDRLGRPVGREVALICLLPVRSCEALHPRLSSFETDLCAVGRQLADRLIAQIHPRIAPEPSRPLPLTFRARESHRLTLDEASATG
jgi:DNA-binding LacI/PurR family transcriptional regulator